jgi:succinate dehydrogenase / fumarate reductase flavoprotein subunit
MGGIVVDPETHGTDVPGLYAAGECVGGLHGANRLGGNSLGEALISGRRAGETAAAFGLGSEVLVRSRRAIDDALDELDAVTRPGTELARPLQRRLRDLMWERCGVVRDENGLLEGLSELEAIRGAAADVDVRPGAEGWTDLALALDLRAGLAVGEATLRGAIERRESRGAHIRVDFPDLDPALQVNFYVDVRMAPWSQPVPPVPAELRTRLKQAVEIGAERLLE